jgi:thiamine-phosphate pyrophosphorylase
MNRLAPASLQLMVIASGTAEDPPASEPVVAAIRGGITLVQVRIKNASANAVINAASLLLPACRAAGLPLLINDRPDLVLVVGADGAHVGADDLPPGEARALLGSLGLGVSVRTEPRLRAAEKAEADYVGVGALRTSPTKPDSTVIGFEGISALVRLAALPVVAVGGIQLEDLPRLKRMGAAGVAVSRGILDAPDPEQAARAYRDGWG